jgi:transposase-like protein
MARRVALTSAEHEYLVTRRQAGASLAMVAAELGCSLETMRKWWRRQRRGQAAPRRGRPGHGILSTYPTELVAEAVRLKQRHPHWGPANVKLQLRRDERFRLSRLPSDARLAALFHARCPDAVQPRQRQAYPERPLPPARQPHQRWQIDGQEKIPLGAADVATVLNVRDPASALMLASQAICTTTARGWRKVSETEVQATLRTAMAEWGRPLAIQTDHEVVYTGSPAADFPSRFTLWLVGLGIEHCTSRNRRPTDQPHIERTHRTLGDMGWKDEPCDQVDQLQAVLDDRRARYNTELPVRAAGCDGHPPLAVYPHARHSGRPYAQASEWELFELAHVDAFLAARVWTRKVSDSGNVAIGRHLYFVQRSAAGQTVAVRFQPATRTFQFLSADGQPLAERPAVGLDKVDLIGFMPLELAVAGAWQLPLPLQGV